jgi:hypothetical protein
MSHPKTLMRLRLVACAAMFSLVAATGPASSDDGTAKDSPSPVNSSLSGYIIAVG